VEKLYAKFGRSVPKGTIIFNEGDPGIEMYIIHEGQVKIIKKVRSFETTLADLGKGDFFGEMAILERGTRSATAIAATDLKLLALDEKTFEMIITNTPEVAIRVMKQMARRVRNADERIETLLFKDATSKVVDMISNLASAKGKTTDDGVVVRTTLEDIAGMIGLEVEKTERVFSNLTNKGFLRMEDDTLIIRDLESFKKILDYIELKEQLGDIG